MRRRLFILFSLAWTALALRASVIAPSILVQNYSVDDYKASSQNWAITTSPEGTLFAANNSGLLTFDGNTWRIYPLPDKFPIHQVYFRDDTIYTRGENSLGYWTHDRFGQLVYQPLDRLPQGIRLENPRVDYTLSPEIEGKHPTARATIGELYLTGTSADGLFITDSLGTIFHHLDINNQLPDNIVHAIYVQDENRIWLALDNGITQIDINPPIAMLGRRNQIGKLEEGTKIGNQLYIKTSSGYFHRELTFGDAFERIPEEVGRRYIQPQGPEKESPAGDLFKNREILGPFINAESIHPVPDGLYWLTAKNEAGLFFREQGIGSLKCRVLFDNYHLNLVTNGRRIIPLDDSLNLVSTMQGTLLINTRQLIEASLRGASMPRIMHVEYRDKKGVHVLPPESPEISLPHDYQELSLYIGTTVLTSNRQISYLLEGISTDWSPWQKEGEITFLQLPAGDYTLRIRKYVPKGPFLEIATRITVRPPWYNTLWAYLLYLALIGATCQALARRYWNNMRKKEEEQIARERQEEQQRLQRLRSEMLEAELQNKNNELTLQTTALVKRNEAIQKLLEELDRQKEALGDRYPNKLYQRLRDLMESTREDPADWVRFESYFNSAHQNFTDRLRHQYADLTTGDLRICCLLRMNLSTKEIASLMNVSVRAIELRRYRLRKRLSLDGETNLVDFLMNF